MRFVLVGAGRVGLRTARVLGEEGHDVTLLERDPEIADRARNEGFEVVEGDGSREEMLVEAGVEEADAVGGLTGDLNTNFVACTVGKHHGCRTVMRIDEDYREDIYREYAAEVDEVVYPERLGALVAKNALLGGTIRAIADVAQHLQVLELTVTEDAPVRGYSMGELQLPANARILAFGKADEPVGIPRADESIEAGDRLIVLADFGVLSDVRQIVVGDAVEHVAAGG